MYDFQEQTVYVVLVQIFLKALYRVAWISSDYFESLFLPQ